MALWWTGSSTNPAYGEGGDTCRHHEGDKVNIPSHAWACTGVALSALAAAIFEHMGDHAAAECLIDPLAQSSCLGWLDLVIAWADEKGGEPILGLDHRSWP